jgi:Cof subfamily protein (haloacid dehalogenase superfamily)
MYKLAAIDLDGTLLHDDMKLSDYTIDVLTRIHKKGIRICFATGRMFSSARKILKVLPIGDVPLAAYTGAWIGLLQSGRVLYQDGIAADVARPILEYARKQGCIMQYFKNDIPYMAFSSALEKEYAPYRIQKTVYLGEKFYTPKEPVTRIIMVEKNHERKDALRAYIEDHFGDHVTVVYPGDDFLDIHKKEVSKARAVEKIASPWSIRPEEMIAFGNTENDLSLFHYVGHSFAVANADPIALKAADEIIESNNDDGVAHTLEKMFL